MEGVNTNVSTVAIPNPNTTAVANCFHQRAVGLSIVYPPLKKSNDNPNIIGVRPAMAGLTPMMFGLSLDFFNGGYTIDSPTALWWKQLATAVVFGLGIATVLTLVFTPSMLALRIWVAKGSYGIYSIFRINIIRDARGKKLREDFKLRKLAKNKKDPEIIWGLE